MLCFQFDLFFLSLSENMCFANVFMHFLGADVVSLLSRFVFAYVPNLKVFYLTLLLPSCKETDVILHGKEHTAMSSFASL